MGRRRPTCFGLLQSYGAAIASAVDPRPIAPADFHRLYKAADDPMKATLLLGLNCCMYAGEVCCLNWNDVDLAAATLTTTRPKAGQVRIAVLWPRTIRALKKLPRKTAAIFVTRAGSQTTYKTFYHHFKATKDAAGLPGAEFSSIRDGAYTTAVEQGIDLNTVKLLAGHATGISDAYVKRRPQMAAAACRAIEAIYFGPVSRSAAASSRVA